MSQFKMFYNGQFWNPSKAKNPAKCFPLLGLVWTSYQYWLRSVSRSWHNEGCFPVARHVACHVGQQECPLKVGQFMKELLSARIKMKKIQIHYVFLFLMTYKHLSLNFNTFLLRCIFTSPEPTISWYVILREMDHSGFSSQRCLFER